ncbi:SusD/RagB family nutrient-binding outer membrane lipoprotein [Mucilaginibacter ginsenosidivorax]|uniref:SusD/RagB family nutrient-binding outer membrane lipoprotein n=1 Tax=Mucilaginibacter ginsenosidivorax TaxID=862126 RepID=A0A5B8W4G0_9SPHI|nr:SusD/RagB family nutrient-binding outer membrane lipoprotein [Mucilaginibacter ginsenosidivorax]QEC78429.1 SusD/RagB family nutrient-binding outer membrane lipoprotein [Mucilaginibacter ginsenosidivorax]
MIKYHDIKRWTMVVTTILFITAVLASCTKNFQKENAPYSGPASATLQQLYTGIGANLDRAANIGNWAEARWLYPVTQLGAVYAVSDFGFVEGQNWSLFYSNLPAMDQMLTTMASSPDSATYTNAIGMVKVLRAYEALEVSNLYGDMPYSKAGKAFSGSTADLKVPYDKQQAVYLSCLADLTWAANHFTNSSTQFSFGSEFLLNNNIDQWKAFANSLRLRYALTMYDKDNTDAAPIIADAIAKLSSNPLTDVVGFKQANVPGISFDIDGAGRGFFFHQESRARMGSTLWNLFSNNNNINGSGIFDLRCKIFFEANGAGNWVPYPQNPATPITDGGDPYNVERDADNKGWAAHKDGNLYSDYNYYWGRDGIVSGSTGACPEIFITPAEVHFLKAEVYARGIAGVAQSTSSAQAEYNAGVTASLTFWNSVAYNSSVWVVNKPASETPSTATINAILANPKVAFNSANALSLIYAQEWVDMFRQPWLAWTLLRRTGGATPMDTSNPAGYKQNYGSLQRYQYPADEAQLNTANWKAATGGSDLTSTKIWITK